MIGPVVLPRRRRRQAYAPDGYDPMIIMLRLESGSERGEIGRTLFSSGWTVDNVGEPRCCDLRGRRISANPNPNYPLLAVRILQFQCAQASQGQPQVHDGSYCITRGTKAQS